MNPVRLLERQPWAILPPLLAEAGAEVNATLVSLRAYAAAVLEWNRGVSNLIARSDEARFVERHLAESLDPAALIRRAGIRRFLDLGSGAGLPALPLALAGIGEAWTLVESRRNKALFIRKMVQKLALPEIVVRCSRLETLLAAEADGLACDGFTSRATLAVGPTLEMAGRVVQPGGRAFLWKGSGYAAEMASARASWSPRWEFEHAWPIMSGPNVLCVFTRKKG